MYLEITGCSHAAGLTFLHSHLNDSGEKFHIGLRRASASYPGSCAAQDFHSGTKPCVSVCEHTMIINSVHVMSLIRNPFFTLPDIDAKKFKEAFEECQGKLDAETDEQESNKLAKELESLKVKESNEEETKENKPKNTEAETSGEDNKPKESENTETVPSEDSKEATSSEDTPEK